MMDGWMRACVRACVDGWGNGCGCIHGGEMGTGELGGYSLTACCWHWSLCTHSTLQTEGGKKEETIVL